MKETIRFQSQVYSLHPFPPPEQEQDLSLCLSHSPPSPRPGRELIKYTPAQVLDALKPIHLPVVC